MFIHFKIKGLCILNEIFLYSGVDSFMNFKITFSHMRKKYSYKMKYNKTFQDRKENISKKRVGKDYRESKM
jgi:hypothetical protein